MTAANMGDRADRIGMNTEAMTRAERNAHGVPTEDGTFRLC